MLNVACPFVFSVPVPICKLPSKNCTMPVGVPVVELETVAVNVTDCPRVAGFGEDLSAVELAALVTVSVSAASVPAANPAVGAGT